VPVGRFFFRLHFFRPTGMVEISGSAKLARCETAWPRVFAALWLGEGLTLRYLLAFALVLGAVAVAFL
jgi:hypothetical protein